MASKRELALQALLAVLQGAHGHVERNGALDKSIDFVAEGTVTRGILVLHDGDPGEPETTLSPLMHHFEHRCEVDVVVAGSDADAQFDALCGAVGAAIIADRTLGGAVDWAEAQAPVPSDLPRAGAKPIKAATIFVVLHYATPDPLN